MGTLMADTQTASPLLMDWLRKDSELVIVKTPKRYEQIIETYGFARPGSHSWFFRFLKERAIDEFRRQKEAEIGEKITFASGVRKYESDRRSRNTAKGNIISHRQCVTPILNWRTEEVWKYIEKHKLQISPCYKTLRRACDCTCQAYGTPYERMELSVHEPEIVERNERLEDKLGGRWSNSKLPNIRVPGQYCLGDCNS